MGKGLFWDSELKAKTRKPRGTFCLIAQTIWLLLHKAMAQSGILRSLEYICESRVAEIVPPPKSLDLDDNFKPEHMLFCRELRFVAIYALFFGDLWAKKVSFWVKTVLLGQEVHYNMVYIAYFTELKSKI